MGHSAAAEFEALQSALRGRYVLDRELGHGGMGIVFLARDVALDRPVAIKLLPRPLAADPDLRARFLLEARTAARLSHPNIVPIHAVEEQGDIACFVMAYVPGETLAERVTREGPLTPDQVGRLVQEVAWALAYAHERRVVHRDIKPENILLERGTGRALVTDFGIARLLDTSGETPPGGVVGTARSMSPEQAAGAELDGRSDLYSLGVTAFFALTGRFPFESGSAAGFLTAHIGVPAPPVGSLRPGVPAGLATAIDRCLAKSPEHRFPTAANLAESLVAAGAVVPAVPAALERLSRETSSLGQDLGGYLTLAGVALLTQIITAAKDFLGFGHVYTIGIALVLTSLAAIRGVQVGRLIREAAREGWSAEDFERALRREAEMRASTGAAPTSLGRAAGMFGAGFVGLALFWLGPKTTALVTMEGPLAILIELVSFVLPVALGRWFAGVLDAPRKGKLGLFTRLAAAKARWLFRLANLGRGRTQQRPALGAAPTEALLADATRALYQGLPASDREVLGDVPGAIAELERNAERLRDRLGEIQQLVAEVGPGGGPRAALSAALEAERQVVMRELGARVSALETIRLDLLRLRAGIGDRAGLTTSLTELRQLSARVDAILESSE
jgi:serine/threonine-protein kinase